MNLEGRMKKLEAELVAEDGIKIVVLMADESEDEARSRVGLDDYQGAVVFITEADFGVL